MLLLVMKQNAGGPLFANIHAAPGFGAASRQKPVGIHFPD
jgi:hypothetical protein